MQNQTNFIKKGGLEESGLSDPIHGKKIRVSTTVRQLYRKIYNDPDFRDYTHTKNEVLNEIIAKDFAKSSSKIVHYFAMGVRDPNKPRYLGEIRNMMINGKGLFRFFVSIIRDEYIDILTIQGKYIKAVPISKRDAEKKVERYNTYKRTSTE